MVYGVPVLRARARDVTGRADLAATLSDLAAKNELSNRGFREVVRSDGLSEENRVPVS